MGTYKIIMDLMMKSLRDAHNKACKLEEAIRNERVELIEEFKNRESSDSNWYISKVHFDGLSAELSKECENFNKFLADLEQTEVSKSENNSESAAEIIENVNESPSTCSEEIEVNSLYNESVPICEAQIIHKTEPQMSQTSSFVKMSEAQIHSVSVPAISEPKVEEKSAEPIEKTKRSQMPIKRGVASIKVLNNSAYKYGGKGFEVFTGRKNRCRAIYGATKLFCKETKRQNVKALKAYLVANGKFNAASIERIEFKQPYYSAPYAIVCVRAPLKIIRHKMKQLNKACGAQTIKVYEPRNYAQNNKANEVLFVSNFDIVDARMHRRFTNLFLRNGELAKDIKMGVDRNGDPFAIVQFLRIEDAANCFDDDLRFGGKKLSIRYSTKM